MTDGILNHPLQQLNKATKVFIGLMFLRIGEIDTLNEKYQAQASIEARWAVDTNQINAQLSADDQRRLDDGKSITLVKYAESHWHPQLYIENALGDLKEQIRYSARRSKEDNTVYVCEHRDVKGVFWEKLELYHFPSDVQDLSISVGSMFYDEKVILLPDPHHVSGVNREAFVDQQEWSLYQHVDAEQRYVKEFIFQADDKEDDEEDGEDANNTEDRKRSIITVTCHAARRSSYFYWNGYCLILLITLVSFCIFAIPPSLAANRIQIACVLLLTSITFRWTVNRSLPTISYLTSLDKYAILCIFLLVVQCIWHAIIGAVVFLNTPDNRVTPSMVMVHIDQYVFFTCIGLFAVLHIGLIAWLFLVPLKHRSNMKKKDEHYQQFVLIKKIHSKNNETETHPKTSPPFSRIPIEAS